MKVPALPEGIVTQRGTCSVCRKDRKLGRHGQYSWRCGECHPLTDEEAKARRKEAARDHVNKPSVTYPIVGGPLWGEFAVTADFYSGYGDRDSGMYAHLADEYREYNCAGGSGRKRQGAFPPTMIFVHKSLLQPLGKPSAR